MEPIDDNNTVFFKRLDYEESCFAWASPLTTDNDLYEFVSFMENEFILDVFRCILLVDRRNKVIHAFETFCVGYEDANCFYNHIADVATCHELLIMFGRDYRIITMDISIEQYQKQYVESITINATLGLGRDLVDGLVRDQIIKMSIPAWCTRAVVPNNLDYSGFDAVFRTFMEVYDDM